MQILMQITFALNNGGGQQVIAKTCNYWTWLVVCQNVSIIGVLLSMQVKYQMI